MIQCMSHVNLNFAIYSNPLWPHGHTLILRHNLTHCSSSTVTPFTPHWPFWPRWKPRRPKDGSPRGSSGTGTATWELESMGCMKLVLLLNVWMLWAWRSFAHCNDLSAFLPNFTSRVDEKKCRYMHNVRAIVLGPSYSIQPIPDHHTGPISYNAISWPIR